MASPDVNNNKGVAETARFSNQIKLPHGAIYSSNSAKMKCLLTHRENMFVTIILNTFLKSSLLFLEFWQEAL